MASASSSEQKLGESTEVQCLDTQPYISQEDLDAFQQHQDDTALYWDAQDVLRKDKKKFTPQDFQVIAEYEAMCAERKELEIAKNEAAKEQQAKAASAPLGCRTPSYPRPPLSSPVVIRVDSAQDARQDSKKSRLTWSEDHKILAIEGIMTELPSLYPRICSKKMEEVANTLVQTHPKIFVRDDGTCLTGEALKTTFNKIKSEAKDFGQKQQSHMDKHFSAWQHLLITLYNAMNTIDTMLKENAEDAKCVALEKSRTTEIALTRMRKRPIQNVAATSDSPSGLVVHNNSATDSTDEECTILGTDNLARSKGIHTNIKRSNVTPASVKKISPPKVPSGGYGSKPVPSADIISVLQPVLDALAKDIDAKQDTAPKAKDGMTWTQMKERMDFVKTVKEAMDMQIPIPPQELAAYRSIMGSDAA